MLPEVNSLDLRNNGNDDNNIAHKRLKSELEKFSSIVQKIQSEIATIITLINDFGIKEKINQILKLFFDSNSGLVGIQNAADLLKTNYESHINFLSSRVMDYKKDNEKLIAAICKLRSKNKCCSKIEEENERMGSIIKDAELTICARDEQIRNLKEKLEKAKIKLDRERRINIESLNKVNELSRQPFTVDDYLDIQNRLDIKEKELDQIRSEYDKNIILLQVSKDQMSDYEDKIENLQSQIKTLRTRRQINIFESEFNFDNPFEGELKEIFNRIRSSEQFEVYQRVQLIFNEFAKVFKQKDDYIASNEKQVMEYRQKAEQASKETNDTKVVLSGLLMQFKVLLANEGLFEKKNIRDDKQFAEFLCTALPPESLPHEDPDAIITELIGKLETTPSLISTLILSYRKLTEQLSRAHKAIDERNEILDDVRRAAGLDKNQDIRNFVKKELSKKKDYKSLVKMLSSEVETLSETLTGSTEINNNLEFHSKKMKDTIKQIYGEKNQLESEKQELITHNKNLSDKLDSLSDKLRDQVTNSKLLKKNFEELASRYEMTKNQSENLANELKESECLNHKLSNDLEECKDALKIEFERCQEILRHNEDDMLRKMRLLEKKHQREVEDIQLKALQLKSTSNEAIGATNAQISELKRVLSECVIKLEDSCRQNNILEEDNMKLKKQCNSYKSKLKIMEEDMYRREERNRFDMKKAILEYQTKEQQGNAEKTLASSRERQRISSIIVRELGTTYGIAHCDVDDDDGLVNFLRRIRDDLKKLRHFQIDNLRQ